MANQYGAPDRTPPLSGMALPTGAGAGVTGGSGTLYYSSVLQVGQTACISTWWRATRPAPPTPQESS